jgi:hypothetical protein
MRFAIVAMSIAALGTCACHLASPTGPVVSEHHAVERGAATRARVEIAMSAGELEVRSGATPLFEGDFDFNVPGLKPAIAYAVSNGLGTLKVSQASANGSYENRWRLTLGESTPVDLEVALAAGDADLVIGRVNLSSLAIRLGAGDVTIDLRGTPARSYRAEIEAGAGDATIYLPKSVAISARTSGLIGDLNVSGLEQRDGRWINPLAVDSPVTVDLQVRHAIGDLRLRAE